MLFKTKIKSECLSHNLFCGFVIIFNFVDCGIIFSADHHSPTGMTVNQNLLYWEVAFLVCLLLGEKTFFCEDLVGLPPFVCNHREFIFQECFIRQSIW